MHPDYLVLSEIMLRGATAAANRRPLEQVLTACQRLGIKAVLPLCSCEPQVAHCRQMGYELGLQTTTPADNLAACSTRWLSPTEAHTNSGGRRWKRHVHEHPTARRGIPGYHLTERLGSGGYAEVWRARAQGEIDKAVKSSSDATTIS